MHAIKSWGQTYLISDCPFSSSEWAMQEIKVSHVQGLVCWNTFNFFQDRIHPDKRIIITFHYISRCHIPNLHSHYKQERKKRLHINIPLTPYAITVQKQLKISSHAYPKLAYGYGFKNHKFISIHEWQYHYITKIRSLLLQHCIHLLPWILLFSLGNRHPK